MRWLVIVVVLLAACASRPNMQIAVRPSDLRAHAAELDHDGQAQIVTVTRLGRGKVTSGDAETVFLGQTVTFGGRSTTVAELLAGCDANHCALTNRDGELVVLRVIPAAELRDRGPSVATPGEIHTNGYNPGVANVFGVLTLASLAGTVGCLIACSDGDRAWSLAPGVAGLVFVVIWAVASGGHD